MRLPAEHLPEQIFATAEVRELERLAITTCGVTDYELMCRAAAAALRVIDRRWPNARSLAIVCGAGNNAGDGIVLARLAQAAGRTVTAQMLVPTDRYTGPAKQAALDARAAGIMLTPFDAAALGNADVVVDAVLGTGLTRPLSDAFHAAVTAINGAARPVLALDIPSGLDADSGSPAPVAVRATATVTFLGLKQGLFLGSAIDHCGELEFDGLDVPVTLAQNLRAPLRRLTREDLERALPRRPRSAHKGTCGRLLLVGGGPGMSGAIRLAAESALRVGAGLVYVATHHDSVASVLAGRPEIICHSVASERDLEPILGMVDGVVIGPGLGQSSWAYRLWRRVLGTELPIVVDADGLNLLAAEPAARAGWVLTPHPGEAARLLRGATVEAVQRDRLASVRALASRYGAMTVLKGPHTLIAVPRPDAVIDVCDRGNPGMATGGTGDVLAGALGSLLVQTGNLEVAVRAGVLLHAVAGDEAAKAGERGTVAGDLLPHLRLWANPS